MPQPELFGAVFALVVAAAHFLRQPGRPKITGGKGDFVRVGNLLADLQKIFGAVFAQVVAAARFLPQLGKRTPPADDDGPGCQLMPPGTPARAALTGAIGRTRR